MSPTIYRKITVTLNGPQERIDNVQEHIVGLLEDNRHVEARCLSWPEEHFPENLHVDVRYGS